MPLTPYRPVLRQGQYWQLRDEAVEFAENRGRLVHEADRGCVVIEGDESLNLGGARVLVLPTSSQTRFQEQYDVLLPHPPAPNRDCVVLVGHPMSVMRDDLSHFVQQLEVLEG
jgi:hypothetical protein